MNISAPANTFGPATQTSQATPHSPFKLPSKSKRALTKVQPLFRSISRLWSVPDTQRVTFKPAAGGPQKAICKRPLPGLPPPLPAEYSAKPERPVSEEQRNKLAAKITHELDAADAEGLDARAAEKKLYKQVWAKAMADSAAFAPNMPRRMSELKDRLLQVQGDIQKHMEEFSVIARAKLPDMAERDIKRAQTNIWPMLCLQVLNNQPMRLTPAMVGFSLLYPLTDDVIDQPSFSRAEKKDFLGRFARLISHGDSEPKDTALERQVWDMFHLIEGDWDRKKFPLVYRVMGELLQAQIDSQLQLAGPVHGRPEPSFDDVWEVTVRKGALSILSDAYLVQGRVSHPEASFASHFGLMTQFLNDIRTIDEDFAEGQYTPFNMLHVRGEKLDGAVDAVFHNFLETFSCDEHARVHGNDPIKMGFFAVMLSFLSFKLIEGVSINQDKFTPEFLAHIDAKSALPLNLIERLYRRQYQGDNIAGSIVPNHD